MSAATPPATPALAVADLAKAYARPAVAGVSFTVQRGECYALLGPNGAGKTTTLRMVAGLIAPDAGAIRIFGRDARADPLAAKRLTAWVPDEPMVYDRLTPREYLAFVAGLWSMDEADAAAEAAALLARLGLDAHADERCEGFSRGMRQKVALAGALIHRPRLLILDEPLGSLDAHAARVVKDLIAERLAGGAAAILTTHILDVAERMAGRIGVIAGGRLIAEGTLAELRAMAGRGEANLEEVFLALTAERGAE